jgi:hypothetical protein
MRDGISKMLPIEDNVYSVLIQSPNPTPFGDKAATHVRLPETTGLTPAEIRRIVLDILG